MDHSSPLSTDPRLPGEGRYLAFVHELITSVQHAEPSTLLASVFRRLTEFTECSVAGLFLFDPHRRSYRLSLVLPESALARPSTAKELELRGADGPHVGEVARRRKPLILKYSDVTRADGMTDPLVQGAQVEVLIPVLAAQTALGAEDVAAIVLLAWSERKCPEHLDDFSDLVSTLLSVGYNNALSHRRRERHIAFLDSVTLDSAADFDQLYQQFLSALANLIPTKFLTLWLYDPDNDALIARAFHPTSLGGRRLTFDDFDRIVISASNSLSGQTLEQRSFATFENAQTKRSFSNPKFASRYGLTWFISFPIIDESQRPIGVINVWPIGEPSDFGAADLQHYQTYVSRVAHTLRTATLLFEESLLNAFDAVLHNLLQFTDNRHSWDSLADLIRTQLDCEDCSVFVLNPSGQLALQGTTGIHNNPPYEAVLYERGQGLTWFAFQQFRPLVYHREVAHKYRDVHIGKFRERVEKSTSLLFVHLTDRNDSPIGVIRCRNKKGHSSRRPGRFTEQDVSAAVRIGQVVSNINAHVQLIKQKEREQERSFRSLHHELLSPIDGILAHVDWLERHAEKRRLADLQDRMLLKCQDMRQIGKLIETTVLLMGPMDIEPEFTFEPTRLYNLLTTCQGFLFNEALSRRLNVILEPMYDLPLISVDPSMMRVLYNLLRNALKYIDFNEASPYVRVSALEINASVPRRVRIRMEDNGVGIPQGEEEEVFEKYKRGSNASKVSPLGEGLGLYYCRKIVEKHKGTITITKRAKPTVFAIELPVHQ
jgi:signal transduction histidine kinase